MKKEKDWFKLKRYPHIGLPLKKSDRSKWIENYITNPENISTHSFMPFIHKTSKVRKFRREYDDDGIARFKIVNGKKQYRFKSEKRRELYYASHLDSLVYSYYAQQISKKYEEKLLEKKLYDVINAYRSVPVSANSNSNKCNIDFANDIFQEILSYDKKEFVVIGFDIKSFFDNLDHQRLREVWMEILGVDRLPPDHFNLFKNITRFSYVDIVDLFEEFKDNIYIQKKNKASNVFPITRKKVSKIKFMRNQEAIAFCSKNEFLKKKNKLLKNHKKIKVNNVLVDRNFGIPQGSPISSLLANMYLLNFDNKINEYIISKGGIYRRYSDDMVVICPVEEKENISDLVYATIKNFKLLIQESKTQIFHFKKQNDTLVCGQEFKTINWNKNFIYLGFEFDGQTVFLKSGSISGYYRKMNRAIARAKKYSLKRSNKNKGEIFKRRIFKKFSYKGATRRRKWLWDNKIAGFKKTEHYDWGNFLSYAYKASNIMINNRIEGQISRHWNKLNKLFKNKS